MELYLNEITDSKETKKIETLFVGETFNHESKLSDLTMKVEYYRAGETICLKFMGDFSIITVCDRCSTAIEVTAEAVENFYLFPESDVSDVDYFYSGDKILLDDFIRETIVMNIPDKILCTEECKGVCSNCGVNFNDSSCDCKSIQTE